MTDAAKLFLAGRLIGSDSRKILAFADDHAATWFQGRSWMAEAIRSMGIEVFVVDIPQDVRDRLRAAQDRQYR
jgi:hypothetical protein